MTYIKEKIKKTKETSDLIEFTKYGLHYATKKWNELETYELRKLDEDELDSLLEDILNDFEGGESSGYTIKQIKEIMSKNWVVSRSSDGHGYESFYFKTKKEALEYIK